MHLIDLQLILMICPPILSILIYYVGRYVFKHKRRAFHFTISWTTLLYIVAVTILIDTNFSINLYGIIPIVLLVQLSIILIIQWKNRTEVILSNGLKLLWRFNFLIFIPLYIGLIVYLLIKHFL